MKEIKVTLPEGADKLDFSVSINKDGEAEVTYKAPVVSVEEKKPEETFKDGDILAAKVRLFYFEFKVVAIYKRTSENGGIIAYTSLYKSFFSKNIIEETERELMFGTECFRPATEEEKRYLFNALANISYRWNAEKKELERLKRWRACVGCRYYAINMDFSIDELIESADGTDKTMYLVGNYFRTREAAERVAEQIREIFKNSKAE